MVADRRDLPALEAAGNTLLAAAAPAADGTYFETVVGAATLLLRSSTLLCKLYQEHEWVALSYGLSIESPMEGNL